MKPLRDTATVNHGIAAKEKCTDVCKTFTGKSLGMCMEKCDNNENYNVVSTATVTTGTCPNDMAYIPPGAFTMGCSSRDSLCDSSEIPTKQVAITKGFCMDKTEVLQSEYQKRIGTNPSKFQDCGGDCPVEQVNWYQAKEYCEKAGKRLPTEAEWEYAARGGTTTEYYWGNNMIGNMANYCDKNCKMDMWKDNVINDGYATTAPVAKYRPNPFGLYDMIGNVMEWAQDCFDTNWYSKMPNIDPINKSSGCETRVMRGGSWFTNAWLTRVSVRYVTTPDLLNEFIGFRCARDIKQKL